MDALLQGRKRKGKKLLPYAVDNVACGGSEASDQHPPPKKNKQTKIKVHLVSCVIRKMCLETALECRAGGSFGPGRVAPRWAPSAGWSHRSDATGQLIGPTDQK